MQEEKQVNMAVRMHLKEKLIQMLLERLTNITSDFNKKKDFYDRSLEKLVSYISIIYVFSLISFLIKLQSFYKH